MRVVMEAGRPGGTHATPGVWKQLGPALTADDPSGSISTEGPDGRQVYIFGWPLLREGRSKHPGVWRSRGGFDVDEGLTRIVASKELELVSDFSDGPVEMVWTKSGLPETVPVRFRLEEE